MKNMEAEIAVLQSQMTEVKASIEALKVDQHSNFTTLALKIDNLANTPLEITTINARLDSHSRQIQKFKNWSWLRNTVSAVLGSVMTALIIYAVLHT